MFINKADAVLMNERRKILSKIQFKEREITKLMIDLAQIDERTTKPE